MATSGSTDFSLTASELISSAYELARVKDPDEALTSKQTSVGQSSLNKLIKYLQKMGMPLWAIEKDSITLVADSQSYTCGTGGTGLSKRPLKILEAFYRDGTSDSQVDIISREEYWALGDKSSDGHVHQIYYDPQLDLGVLYVYNPASTTTAGNTLHLVYQRPFEDIDSTADTFDFPQEWYSTIEYNLAVDLALRNGVKQSRITQLKSQAMEYFYEVSWWDRENTGTQITPDAN